MKEKNHREFTRRRWRRERKEWNGQDPQGREGIAKKQSNVIVQTKKVYLSLQEMVRILLSSDSWRGEAYFFLLSLQSLSLPSFNLFNYRSFYRSCPKRKIDFLLKKETKNQVKREKRDRQVKKRAKNRMTMMTTVTTKIPTTTASDKISPLLWTIQGRDRAGHRISMIQQILRDNNNWRPEDEEEQVV